MKTWLVSFGFMAFAASCVADTIELRIGDASEKRITPLHFGVNCEFFRGDIYFGTLPASDPRSKRQVFAQALNASGIHAIRFPGGNAAYYYLAESSAETMELAHAINYWELREDNPPSSHFVTLENLASFCREHDVKLVYELPVLFYLDGDRPRATIQSEFSKRARNYDRDRIAECAAYARGIVMKLRKLGAPVAVWELGNEEFAHCDARDYAKVCAALAAAIREVDSHTPIVPVGMGRGWLEALVPALRELGALEQMAGFNAHYPFGAWPGPGDRSKRGDPAAFVKGDLRMDKWLNAATRARKRLNIPGRPISVTETMVMRYKNWRPHAVVCTHAYALVYAWNCQDLLSHPLCDIAVYHDLGTPFFGMMRYDAGFDTERRMFVWLKRAKPDQKLKRFPDQYVLSPTAYANKLLSSLIDARVCSVTGLGPRADQRAIAGRFDDGSVALIVVNRSLREHAILVEGATLTQTTTLTADGLDAALPGSFRFNKSAVTRSAIPLPPWSVVAAESRDSR